MDAAALGHKVTLVIVCAHTRLECALRCVCGWHRRARCSHHLEAQPQLEHLLFLGWEACGASLRISATSAA